MKWKKLESWESLPQGKTVILLPKETTLGALIVSNVDKLIERIKPITSANFSRGWEIPATNFSHFMVLDMPEDEK